MDSDNTQLDYKSYYCHLLRCVQISFTTDESPFFIADK